MAGLVTADGSATARATDEERVNITNVTDAMVTKAKLRLITGGAG